MSKVFRLYTDGADTYQDWRGVSAFPYDSDKRDKIDDPEGDNAKKVEITSIPSPFARIDIAKNAFDEVNRIGMEGTTTYHKTVSDILDVGEIFFNIDKYRDFIEIITWHPTNFEKMLSSEFSGNRYLGEALKTYLESGEATYNFDMSQNIYILNYKNGKHGLDVIGATSPATIFFSSANDLSYLSPLISFIKDHPFDSEYAPLYKRDFEYIKAWCIMRELIPGFSSKLPEVHRYLNKTIELISDIDQRNELKNVTKVDATKYNSITADDNGQTNIVELFGQPILMKVVRKATDSDFVIRPTVETTSHPLVLPVESGNTYNDFYYTGGSWGSEAKAPYYDNNALSNRKLPFDGRQQEYLTISDFLEDVIVKVPHKLNSEFYVNAMTFEAIGKNREYTTYLLPLKEKFFEYFKIEDLYNKFSENNVGIMIEELVADSVLVTLQIPVKGHGSTKVITYTRRYSGEQPTIESNKGGIETFEFDAFVMPLVKDKDKERAFYTVSCLSTVSRNYPIKFFNGKTAIDNVKVDCRNQNSKHKYKAVNYTLMGNNFDYLQISNDDGVKNIIIPRFIQNRASNIFKVSVDVGTSNTHIEIAKNSDPLSNSYELEENEPVLCPIFTHTVISEKDINFGPTLEENIIIRDYLPSNIGEKYAYKYPTRTVLSHAKEFKDSQDNLPYGLYNVSFTYDKIADLDYNENNSNIKWGKDDTLLKDYIENIMLQIRNKILASDGDLAKTEMTWFFPTSMPMKRKNILQRTWDETFNKYFGNGGTQPMTESSAPIRYLFYKEASATDIVSIDIGGGTTDIAFAKNKEILSVTSFRFASNVLFEDQLAPINLANGIIDHFKEVILSTIKESGKFDTMLPLFNASTHQKPADMASFLFSLRDNDALAALNKDKIDFNLILNQDENFKIVFILFYTAILYHIGKIIKYKGYNLPRHISFSGNGSKILNVISTNTQDLADYTKFVLEKVTGHEFKNALSLVGLSQNDNPKTSTCKGGIRANVNTLKSDPIILMRANGLSEINDELTYEDLKDNNIKSEVISGVKDFFNFVLNDIPKKYKYNFDDHFGVTEASLNIARSIMNNDLETYLDKGISIQMEENCEKDRVEETLFFVPIKGVLNAITQTIYDTTFNNLNYEP
jgi:hypothetical protein